MFCYLIDGDLMKKTMLLAVIFVVLGAVCGNYLYKKAPDTVSVFQTNQTFISYKKEFILLKILCKRMLGI